MPNNFGDKQNTNGFDKRPEDRGRGGRPKKVLTKFKEAGYTKTQVKDTFSVIGGLNVQELQDIIDDNEGHSAIEQLTAKAYIEAIKSGNYQKVKDIIEMFADKPKQSKEVETTVTTPEGVAVVLTKRFIDQEE